MPCRRMPELLLWHLFEFAAQRGLRPGLLPEQICDPRHSLSSGTMAKTLHAYRVIRLGTLRFAAALVLIPVDVLFRVPRVHCV